MYLLVVGLLIGQPFSGAVVCNMSNPPQCPEPVYAPRVDFFLSQDNAAKEYAAQPKGSARLFKIRWPTWACPKDGITKLEIKELNVLPAQSYEVSDKASVEARP